MNATYFILGLLVGVLSTVFTGVLLVLLRGLHESDESRRLEPYRDVIKNLPEW